MLKKCIIVAVSLLTIQSMTYAADKEDSVVVDSTSSIKTTEVVKEDEAPDQQPQDKGAESHTVTTKTKKNKTSCWSCFGKTQEK